MDKFRIKAIAKDGTILCEVTRDTFIGAKAVSTTMLRKYPKTQYPKREVIISDNREGFVLLTLQELKKTLLYTAGRKRGLT